MDTPGSMLAAHLLINTYCRRRGRFPALCAQVATQPADAGRILGTLAYVIIFESLPGGPVNGPTELCMHRSSDGEPTDIDTVDPVTRAVARTIAALAGGDLAMASAIILPWITDPEPCADLLARMTAYAHAAAHHLPVVGVTFDTLDHSGH
jgi:hypothetical protein